MTHRARRNSPEATLSVNQFNEKVKINSQSSEILEQVVALKKEITTKLNEMDVQSLRRVDWYIDRISR